MHYVVLAYSYLTIPHLSILCHITPLVINILGGRHTHTHMHMHTHTDFLDKAIVRNQVHVGGSMKVINEIFM